MKITELVTEQSINATNSNSVIVSDYPSGFHSISPRIFVIINPSSGTLDVYSKVPYSSESVVLSELSYISASNTPNNTRYGLSTSGSTVRPIILSS